MPSAVAAKPRSRKPEPRPYHHGDLRASLLATAARWLDERGAETLTLRELARAAGVSHAAPYHHFANRDALMAGVAEHAFDRLGGVATDRAMIRACPVTWPWNLLGWPSINVPAGFTSDGLPIGVQLMGPADSEPLLVSLAAELEVIGNWSNQQPDVWWDQPGTD